jgi:toxin FitB
MRLVDSNIIIYATAPENEWLRTWLEVEPFAVSQISQIEVLGYHQITPEEITDLEEFLYSSNIVPVTDGATKKAIALRQRRKMSLADSILAATALENDWELGSRNVDDFEWIAELRLVNPFDFHT